MKHTLPDISYEMGITEFFDFVAQYLGRTDIENIFYNCTKLWVSKDIAEEIANHYNDDLSFGMFWCCYGPKVDETLEKHTILVEDGFITSQED